MTSRSIAVAWLSVFLSACGTSQAPLSEPKQITSALVDNLMFAQPTTDTSNMSLDTVSFELRGRCLEVLSNGSRYVPIFVSPDNNIVVSGSGIRLPYIDVKFEITYYVEGPLVPEPVKSKAAGNCPSSGLLMRGIAPRNSVPQPATPPLNANRSGHR